MNNDKLLDHDYDGIRELDNPLPGWWLATFYGAIVFAVLYVYAFHVNSNKTSRDNLNQDLAEVKAAQKASGGGADGPQEEKLLAMIGSVEAQNKGKGIFQEKCLSCHGPAGQGGIGPNLTDDYWLHGDGKPMAIATTVFNGVAEKGMPPWKALLPEEDIYAVVSFVRTLHGTHPENPKAPQGNLVHD